MIGALFAREETQAWPTPIQPACRWREPRQAAASIGDRQDEREASTSRAGRSGACVGLRGHPGRGPGRGRVAKPKDRRRTQSQTVQTNQRLATRVGTPIWSADRAGFSDCKTTQPRLRGALYV